MSSEHPLLPRVYLARHGETAWTITRQHTGLTDLPLTHRGELNARQLGETLKGINFARVFSSPLRRAWHTCELAGFGAMAAIEDDLVEWNYGQYEGKTTAEIRQQRPHWDIFANGCPEGESPAEVAARVQRVVERIRALDGDVLLFAHSHCFRVFAACWLGLDPAVGRHFYLGTAALSIVGYHHERSEPVIHLWNERSHLFAAEGTGHFSIT